VAEGRENRPPRGALVVIAVGLFACLVAALLSTDKPLGAVELEWERRLPLPDSRPASIPGGGRMQLTDAGLRVTEANASDYRLYRVAAVLRIDADSAVGQGRLRCGIRVPRRTIIAKTRSSRASYPRSSEDLFEQEAPEQVQVEFNSRSTDFATLELGDAVGERYTDQRGIVVEWAPYRIGEQVWQWGLPPGTPTEPLALPFASIWRTTGTPGAKVSCTIETDAGAATVRAAGALVD
jgi:hypothetical protein